MQILYPIISQHNIEIVDHQFTCFLVLVYQQFRKVVVIVQNTTVQISIFSESLEYQIGLAQQSFRKQVVVVIVLNIAFQKLVVNTVITIMFYIDKLVYSI